MYVKVVSKLLDTLLCSGTIGKNEVYPLSNIRSFFLPYWISPKFIFGLSAARRSRRNSGALPVWHLASSFSSCLTHRIWGLAALESHSTNLPVFSSFISCQPKSFSSWIQHEVQQVPSHASPSSPFRMHPIFIPFKQVFLQSSVISSERQLQGRSALNSPLGLPSRTALNSPLGSPSVFPSLC